MSNGKQHRFYKHIEKAHFIRVHWSVEAETLERNGQGEKAALARAKADNWLKFEREVGDIIWF